MDKIAAHGWQYPRQLIFRTPAVERVAPNSQVSGNQGVDIVFLPNWVGVITALGGFGLAYWFRKRKRRMQGCCEKCDYDLRATPTGVCPECGANNPPQPCEPQT